MNSNINTKNSVNSPYRRGPVRMAAAAHPLRPWAALRPTPAPAPVEEHVVTVHRFVYRCQLR